MSARPDWLVQMCNDANLAYAAVVRAQENSTAADDRAGLREARVIVYMHRNDLRQQLSAACAPWFAASAGARTGAEA